LVDVYYTILIEIGDAVWAFKYVRMCVSMGYDGPDEMLQVLVERAPEREREREPQRILPQNFHMKFCA